MFDVMDLSWFILRRCAGRGTPISNLHLQKILFFLQRLSLQQNNERLFPDEIEAWQYGPVVPRVYKSFSFYSAMQIIPTIFDPEPRIDLPLNLIQEIDARCQQNPWRLVEETHILGGAWDITFSNGLGNRNVIPVELIAQ